MNNSDEPKITRGSRRKKRAALRAFSPSQPITLLGRIEIVALQAAEISAAVVGWKAFGLSCLPADWVPPFFVIEKGVVDKPTNGLEERITRCLTLLGLESAELIVRSSGTAETIEQRGRLFSATCSHTDVVSTIRELLTKLSSQDSEKVHWIVQRYEKPVRQGHLSNERRFAREPRDFVAEIQMAGDRPGYTAAVRVRHWRNEHITDFDLSCTSEPGITLKLRQVALWATALPHRMLFEWTWNGERVWIVQADVAKSNRGVNPRSLRPASIPSITSEALRIFRVAKKPDFSKYRKLKNARTYAELGYNMPKFYVLDDKPTIKQVLAGKLSKRLLADLDQLTKRPLIIRTDGIAVPDEKREMLPRSDGLNTMDEAKKWLLEKFSQEVKRIGLEEPLCLIAHHFIPSVAAAWARAGTSSSIVRIESLWGLPEGLYWYSHDTFEVDVSNPDLTTLQFRKRLRYKGTFVAPDADGRWIHFEPLPPLDWGRSITREDWLREIAHSTKRVAQHDKQTVNVMWFVDNDPRATPHPVLPWYHTKSEIGSAKAAPRRKLTTATDYRIETGADWQELQSRVKAGRRVERVMLEPKDPELLRNQEFARELAKLAVNSHIVIELAGGVLSHAYHILRREGAQVECIDLFGADEEHVEYNKIVRDKIPGVIKRKGENAEIIRLRGEALLAALRQKLIEESFEALDARSGDELIGELADVQEVIAGICEALQIPGEQVNAEQAEKRKKRGGFQSGIMLRRTSTPHSLSVEKRSAPTSPALSSETIEDVTVEQASALPSARPYVRPDFRNVDRQQEGLLTFETEVNRIGSARHSTAFEIAVDEREPRKFKLFVELTRRRATIWGQVRLRVEPTQIPMNLNQLALFKDDPEK